MNASRGLRVLWGLAGAAVLVLVVKSFVADVYRVDSGSMRPTLFGGRSRADEAEDTERVLVVYDRAMTPERFDLVVVRSPDGTKPLVKRVVGVPGDRDLVVQGGDLFVGHARLPVDAPRPAPIPVYDDRYFRPEDFFERRDDGSVRREGEAWLVTDHGPPPGSLLSFGPPLRDDYLDRHHRRVHGVVEVNDAVLELEFRLSAPAAGARLHFQLVEAGDTFDAVLACDEDGRGSLELRRLNQETLRSGRDAAGQPLPSYRDLVRASLAVPAGVWHDLAFANVDNRLRVRSRSLGLDAGHEYAANEPWPGTLPLGQTTLGPRVRFGVEGGEARFRGVRILRDLFYTDNGTYAVQARPGEPQPRDARGPISLGPDEYFLLGDNSAASTDSRHFGPCPGADLVGRPVWVLWPEPRRLRPTGP
jgi:signal peptidase I